ncbi:MAG: YciC family protein [Gammaproteobacteria bacterium]
MSDGFHLPASSQSARGVLATGVALYRETLGVSAPLAVAAQAIALLPHLPTLFAARGAAHAPPPGDGALLALLVCLAASLVPWLAMTARCWARAYGQDMDLGTALTRALRLLPRTLAATLLYVLLVTIGLALLLVPGIYLGVALMLYPIILLAEDRGYVESHQRSFHLLRGHWWRASLVVSAPTTLVLVLGLLGQVLPLMSALGMGGGALDAPLLVFLVNAGTLLLYTLALPLVTTVLIALYHDLLLAHEARGVMHGARAG